METFFFKKKESENLDQKGREPHCFDVKERKQTMSQLYLHAFDEAKESIF